MRDSPIQTAQVPLKPRTPTEPSSPPVQPTSLSLSSFQILSSPAPCPLRHCNFDLLLQEKIDPLHRLKVLKWLRSQAVRQNYYREVFAYAADYLDRFLALSPKIALEDLQIYALGALLLATKIEGAVFPRLGRAFDSELILAAEERIGIQLGFFLHPKTYVQLLSQLTSAWDCFADKEGLYEGQRYLPQSLGGFRRHRALHERMECVYMAPQSHRFSIEALALNLFFLHNKLDIQPLPANTVSPEQEMVDFVRESYCVLQGYRFTFQQFLMGVQGVQAELDEQVGTYLGNFLQLPVGNDPPNRRCVSYQSYLRMQTSTEQGTKALDRLAKSSRQRQ